MTHNSSQPQVCDGGGGPGAGMVALAGAAEIHPHVQVPSYWTHASLGWTFSMAILDLTLGQLQVRNSTFLLTSTTLTWRLSHGCRINISNTKSNHLTDPSSAVEDSRESSHLGISPQQAGKQPTHGAGDRTQDQKEGAVEIAPVTH